MTKNRFPEGWDEARVRRVLEHYESQSEDEAVAEDAASGGKDGKKGDDVIDAKFEVKHWWPAPSRGRNGESS